MLVYVSPISTKDWRTTGRDRTPVDARRRWLPSADATGTLRATPDCERPAGDASAKPRARVPGAAWRVRRRDATRARLASRGAAQRGVASYPRETRAERRGRDASGETEQETERTGEAESERQRRESDATADAGRVAVRRRVPQPRGSVL